MSPFKKFMFTSKDVNFQIFKIFDVKARKCFSPLQLFSVQLLGTRENCKNYNAKITFSYSKYLVNNAYFAFGQFGSS